MADFEIKPVDDSKTIAQAEQFLATDWEKLAECLEESNDESLPISPLKSPIKWIRHKLFGGGEKGEKAVIFLKKLILLITCILD